MAQKPPQKMFLEPTILYYPPPLATRNISNTITVYNRSEVQCIFKVHSSEPELYIVKPSSGILPPKSALRVTITLRRMGSEPADITEFGKKQRFKVRGKVIPPTIAAKVSASSHASDIWKQCDSAPLEMDTALECNFSGDVPKVADVTFEAGSEQPSVVSPMSKEDPYATAKRAAAAAAAAKNVTFGAPDGGSANGGIAIKSSLKGGEIITPKNANELVSTESAGIKANTTTKLALAGTVGEIRDQKSQLEKEIKDRQALLANLKASTLPAAAVKPKKKGGAPTMSLATALVLIILFYVGGTFARVKVGGDNVSRYIEEYVSTEVRSAVTTSRMAIDGAIAPVIQQVSNQFASIAGSSQSSAVTITPSAGDLAMTKTAVDKKEEIEVAKTSDVPAAVVETEVKTPTGAAATENEKQEDASVSQQPAKKRRKKKVAKKD